MKAHFKIGLTLKQGSFSTKAQFLFLGTRFMLQKVYTMYVDIKYKCLEPIKFER